MTVALEAMMFPLSLDRDALLLSRDKETTWPLPIGIEGINVFSWPGNDLRLKGN